MQYKITPYCFLKISYESKVTWKTATDYLRCSPKFYGQPRYDYVIIQTVEKPIFGQLVFVFTITIGKYKYPLALVQPFDAPVDALEKDVDLGFFRLKAQSRAKTEIFPVASIIRGALLVRDFDSDENEYLVLDVIDGDMFLRVLNSWGHVCY